MDTGDGKLVPFLPQPGIWRQSTTYAEKGKWYDSDKIRWRNGRPEKLGGWQRISSETFEGIARDLHDWVDLSSRKLLALGTQCYLYVNYDGQFYDITPYRTVTTVVNGINTSVGSSAILVSSAGHGMLAGDYVFYTSMVATVGGNVFLSGLYTAVTVPSNDSYVVEYAQAAAATSASTGEVTENFYINCGTTSNVAGLGWGVGTWGTGTWGTPRSGSSVVINMRTWSIDNFGENLVACYNQGPLFYWDNTTNLDTRAVIVTAAPSMNGFVFVSEQDRHVFALGSTDVSSGAYDPMLIRWCSQENYQDWLPSATNTAGFKTISGGNQLVGGINSKNQNLAWTDSSLFSITFIGPPYTFAIRKLGDNCGLISPHAAAEAGGKVYWMSSNSFYMYDGGVKALPCSLQKYVFNSINFAQSNKVYCAVNTQNNEIFWGWPSGTDDDAEPYNYVKYNYMENLWDMGTLTRTAWVDKGSFSTPIAAGNNLLYYQDIEGYWNDDGAPMQSYLRSTPQEIGEGDQLMFIDRFIPDFELSGTVNVTFGMQKYPLATTVTKGPFIVQQSTQMQSMRARGRQGTITIDNNGLGEWWQLGSMRLRIKEDGGQ